MTSCLQQTKLAGRTACKATRVRGIQRTLEDIQTDTAELVDIGVVNLGEESDLRWGHRIVVWQEELQLEDTAYVGVRIWSTCGSFSCISPSYGDCVGPCIMTSKYRRLSS